MASQKTVHQAPLFGMPPYEKTFYIHSQVAHNLIRTARTSRFGLETNELEVREGRENAVRICLEMLSPGPLLQDVVFDLVGQSGSATGEIHVLYQSQLHLL